MGAVFLPHSGPVLLLVHFIHGFDEHLGTKMETDGIGSMDLYLLTGSQVIIDVER